MAKLKFQQPLIQPSLSHDLSKTIPICWFRNIFNYLQCWKRLCCL